MGSYCFVSMKIQFCKVGKVLGTEGSDACTAVRVPFMPPQEGYVASFVTYILPQLKKTRTACTFSAVLRLLSLLVSFSLQHCHGYHSFCGSRLSPRPKPLLLRVRCWPLQVLRAKHTDRPTGGATAGTPTGNGTQNSDPREGLLVFSEHHKVLRGGPGSL